MFVGIAGSMGRMERANDNAAYDESRSVDAVTGNGGMRRNTPGAREERTDARGRAARMSSTQQSTNDGRKGVDDGDATGFGRRRRRRQRRDSTTRHDTTGIRRARGRRGREATRRRRDGRDAMGRLMRNVGRATTTSDDDKDDDDNERDGGTTSGSISPPGGGGGVGGIGRCDDCILNGVRFTSLPWIEWQLVREWRTRTYK